MAKAWDIMIKALEKTVLEKEEVFLISFTLRQMERRKRSHLLMQEDRAARERRDGVPGASRKARAGDSQIPERQFRREGVWVRLWDAV